MKVVKYTSSWMEIKLTTLAAIDTYFIRYYDHDYPLRKKGEFENIKGVIRCRSMGDRQHNGQIHMDKKTNNDQQNTTQKTKDCETRTPLKTEVNSCAPEGLAVTALLVASVVVLFLQTRK